jgi:hypothetical protein
MPLLRILFASANSGVAARDNFLEPVGKAELFRTSTGKARRRLLINLSSDSVLVPINVFQVKAIKDEK